MNDPRPGRVVGRRQSPRGEEPLDERRRPRSPGARMHDEAGGLVHSKEVSVLVEDVELEEPRNESHFISRVPGHGLSPPQAA